ncbi:MAG: T9SS type A sorting domain-containing protein [Chitinophagales bacterium]|nr:T9SS type A sorting domain-containing protein [Chitinophagales bacterium]
MKKIYTIVAVIFILFTANAATGDTTVIVAHTLSNLASPPSNDDEWVVFPNAPVTYQQIIMKFTLGCGTPNCSGWDYTVNASLGKKSGTLDSTIVAIDTLTNDTTWSYADHVDFIEIGRLITPYGTYMANNSNGYNNSWTHPYYYDIADYASLLKDSVNVRVHYDGWTDAFSARVEFIFIEGTPTRTVQNVQTVYNTYIGYPNSAGFESVAVPKQFYIDPSVTSAKLALIMTGHGSQGEFDPYHFHLKVNSTNVYSRLLWKDDCGMNAIAPQGGTWIFNRANWCPGEKVPVYEVDITPYITPGQTATIDLDFDDYVVQQGQGAGYGTSLHLITYTNQKNNDVMLEEIIAPNADKPYIRFNPICTTPKVKIKNMGKLPLTYAEISYWIKGGTKWYYEWTGNLQPFESAVVDLPAFDWFALDTNDRKFYAEAQWPNNVPDEYVPNNKLESSFNMTPVMDSVFYIFFRANNRPEENWYVVRNEDGDTISFKNTFVNNVQYRDTLHLVPGSYSFDFYDYDAQWEGGDGISWWLNTQQGWETTGQLNLRKLNNTIIKNFNGDFGNNVHYEFTVGYPLGFNTPKNPPTPPVHPSSIEEVPVTSTLHVFPNPADDIAEIRFQLNIPAACTVLLTDMTGRVIQQHQAGVTESGAWRVDTGELAGGIYFVTLKAGTTQLTRKLIVK